MIRRISPDDVETLRDIRLRALQDAPDAFASTYDAELAFPTERWIERATRCSAGNDDALFLAFDGDSCVGIAGAYSKDDLGADHQLISMWVAPTHRGTHVAQGLVEAILTWAGDSGARTVGLWVTRGNDRALRFYERMGFVVTGDVQPLPSDPCKDEIRMLRQTEAPSDTGMCS